MEVTSALQTEQHVKNELAKRLGELQEKLGELKETVSPEPWQTDSLEGGGRLGQDKAAPAGGRGGEVVGVWGGTGLPDPGSFQPACGEAPCCSPFSDFTNWVALGPEVVTLARDPEPFNKRARDRVLRAASQIRP